MATETTLAEKVLIDDLDPKKFIIIKGAKVNNLKNLSVAIPRNKFVVITGLSGSGKSSLAFDTLFAEGQRMYVESLSSYARQFIGRMEKPEVEYIKGVSPAIAIEQKVNTKNPRSTVGTTTEIYDYLKLFFARIGVTTSPATGKAVSKDTISDVVDFLYGHEEGTKFMVLCPVKVKNNRNMKDELSVLLQKGFTRVVIGDEMAFIEDVLGDDNIPKSSETRILIDRSTIVFDKATLDGRDEDNLFRISDSVQTAFFEGEGDCDIVVQGEKAKAFSDRFEENGTQFEEPTVNLFSFNNPYGACRRCEGFGNVLGIDEDLVIPDKNLSIFEGAIAPWRSEIMKKWKDELIKSAGNFDFPIHRPFADLSQEQKELVWSGNKYFSGIDDFFAHLESQLHKIQYRVLLSRYRGRTVCPDCRGTRIRKDASYVKIDKKSITDLVLMSIGELRSFFKDIRLSKHQEAVAKRILIEIRTRLDYLDQVGLKYLNLNRLTSSLSGGEYQRIKLATSLGSALVGSMYILDEPSIGLHPRDTARLIQVIKSLRDTGNTVIVVEHEEEVMQAADQIIDIGPDAGSHGGELVFQGTLEELMKTQSTHTARYLSGKVRIEVPSMRRKWKDKISVLGARENNLKRVDVDIPLDALTVVTGVSGSGKSTLVKKVIYPAIGKFLGTVHDTSGKYDSLGGDYNKVTQIEFVDQNPIGKSSRSNPVTYVKAYDPIRQLFSEQGLAKQRGYKPSHFSFNVDGGRCEVCEGEGIVKIEMQFMADLQLTCESCKGKRFKNELLEVTYQDKNISDILDMTIEESMIFFADKSSIAKKLAPLFNIGLGYVHLGQSSNSLSGGEAQRVKLASFLGKGKGKKDEHILFIFDEPTTGLHFHDISRLLDAMNALVNQGNSVLIIEHNMEVIKSADWIIDLGPEGGDAGGNICFAGTPEEMINIKDNYTATFLKNKLSAKA